MYKYITLILLAVAFISCKNNSSSPTSSNNNNNNGSAYFVDWTIGGQHYKVTSDVAVIGACVKTQLGISALPASGSQYPHLILAIDTVKGDGNYDLLNTTTSHAGIIWYASSTSGDIFTVLPTAPQSSGTITITDFSTTSVSGNFTAKVAKFNVSSMNYDYLDVTGSFTVQRLP